jgi:hypothetical protein
MVVVRGLCLVKKLLNFGALSFPCACEPRSRTYFRGKAQ